MDAKSETKSFPMKGGNDQSSYVNNSSLQRISVDLSKEIIEEAISKNLNTERRLQNPKTLRIADLGCSVGSNTLAAVQNIVEAVDHAYKSHGTTTDHVPAEFQVFFNDHASNDFNTLFLSLPLERRYFAAGVPGSFYTRLFPQGSLDIVYSSTALHWLSQVPKEVVDIDSSAWNKGRIHYTDAPFEVLQAYSAQHVLDMEAFLLARAHEVVCGGLMFLVLPGVIDGTQRGSQTGGGFYDVLGSCLMEMAKMGTVDEAKVDSFNLPVYYTSPREVNELVEKNVYFSTERLEKMHSPGINLDHVQIFSHHLRAGLEVIIKQHFGFSKSDLDILFDMYTERLADSFPALAKAAEKSLHMFLVLKRNNISIAH